jgi:SAM-dependent methyltransferase
MNEICPNCNGKGMTVFYQTDAVPVHSCLMMDQQEKAQAYPTRDLALGLCEQCGFISNVIFDPAAHEYSNQYEDQQSFSPKFRDFQTRLCRDLIERYDIRRKKVLEIGCSKGDFLIELCEMGENDGIGVDPSSIPERARPLKAGSVEFIADYYSEKYAHIECDVVCCRHTLEHIYQTHEFVSTVRHAIGDRKDTLVFFEVPDTGRVLREQAFWDIYYEHCSYFTPGSLSRVFKANRFEVLELSKDFDDQYLLLVARPVDQPVGIEPWETEDLEQTKNDAKTFAAGVHNRLSDLNNRIQQAKARQQRVAIWGSGSKCVSFLSSAGINGEIDSVVDINPYRHGRFLAGSGKQVDSPEVLRELKPDVIFIMNPIYRGEIQNAVDEMGLQTELVAI